jgi:hypothetical protein
VKPWTACPALWGVWWLGDALGVLVVAPLLLTWAGGHCLPWRPWRVAEAGALLLGLVAVSLRGLVYLARHGDGRPLASAATAKAEGPPERFLLKGAQAPGKPPPGTAPGVGQRGAGGLALRGSSATGAETAALPDRGRH